MAHLIGNVRMCATPRANAMAHNDKTKNAPLVILPFVFLSLCIGIACTLSKFLHRTRVAQAVAINSNARKQSVDRTAKLEGDNDAAG